MKIERKNLNNSVVELIIETDTKSVAKNRKKAIAHLTENADIKGFRKGASIPEAVIVKHFGEAHIAQMTVEFAIDSVYQKALMEEKLVPVAQGEIKEVISQDPLKFKLHIEVLPTLEIDSKYKKIKLTKKKISVWVAEVKKALEEIETKFTKFVETTDKKSKTAMWDKVTIDTDWFDSKGKIIETTSMRDYPLVLGSGLLVPGFEEGMVWSKVWDNLELDVPFPKDYHNKDFAWKNTKFRTFKQSSKKSSKKKY